MLYNSGLLLFAGPKTTPWTWLCRWHYNVVIYLSTQRQKLVVEVWALKPQCFLSKFLNVMYVVAYFLQNLACSDTGKIIILTVGWRQSHTNSVTIQCRRIPNDPHIVHRSVLRWTSRTPGNGRITYMLRAVDVDVEPIHLVALHPMSLSPNLSNWRSNLDLGVKYAVDWMRWMLLCCDSKHHGHIQCVLVLTCDDIVCIFCRDT